jgi:hypothetical protein
MQEPKFFEYFLDPRNHRPAIPIDMISYHFYATPTPDETPEVQQFTVFDQADRFLSLVKYIELIRQRLSPDTRTTIDEIGIISAADSAQGGSRSRFQSPSPIHIGTCRPLCMLTFMGHFPIWGSMRRECHRGLDTQMCTTPA